MFVKVQVTPELIARMRDTAITNAKYKSKAIVDPSVLLALVDEINEQWKLTMKYSTAKNDLNQQCYGG